MHWTLGLFGGVLPVLFVIVIVITNQDSTSSRLLPGSSYSCCIRNLHALVHKQCHPVVVTCITSLSVRLCLIELNGSNRCSP
jgi:hypothetical protein